MNKNTFPHLTLRIKKPADLLSAPKASGLQGSVVASGDKSISHRLIILSSLAVGQSHLRGVLESADVFSTARAMAALGSRLERVSKGVWKVYGAGLCGLQEPEGVLDFGNSGTGARLILGVLASHAITTTVTGDASLTQRPMARVLKPLQAMGARFSARKGGYLPLTCQGLSPALPISYRMPVASAQVKSCILLAGLQGLGTTTVIETTPTRDHTEKLLPLFGTQVSKQSVPQGTAISVTGGYELSPVNITVPGDPSSAAFLLAAGLLVPNAQVEVKNVMLNPHRDGYLDVMRAMGGKLDVTRGIEKGVEKVGHIKAQTSTLRGVDVSADKVASTIDEYPILAVLAAFAQGTTVMRGLKELRHKESDRIHAMARGLQSNGVTVQEHEDSLVIEGNSNGVPGGGRVAAHHDHRITMAFLIMSLASTKPITVDGGAMIATSYPDFIKHVRSLQGEIHAVS